MKYKSMVGTAFMELPERTDIDDVNYKLLKLELYQKHKASWKLDNQEVINSLPVNTKAFYGDCINDKDFAIATILEREFGSKEWIWDNGNQVPLKHQIDLVLGKSKQDVIDYFNK